IDAYLDRPALVPLPVPVRHRIEQMPLAPRHPSRVFFERRFRRLDEEGDVILFPQRIAVVRLGTFPSTDVDVAAEGQVPRKEVLFLPVAAPADAGFADVGD